jgi:DNA mismatch endonuclease (patch repair protein)
MEGNTVKRKRKWMTDELVLSKTSHTMSRIGKGDTKPEILVRKFLFSLGFRYRLHQKNLSGTPDIVLRKYKLAIFIDGCFWHGHEGCYKLPKTRAEFWRRKIEGNKARDCRQRNELESKGWHVFVIHECELNRSNRGTVLNRLISFIDDLNNFSII